jgi:hypothetical protein
MTDPSKLRDAGMARVTAASDPIIVATIDALIEAANATGEPWSANDIRACLPEHRHPLVGARVRAAATRRPVRMRKVGYTQSTLPSTHSHEIKVWQGV